MTDTVFDTLTPWYPLEESIKYSVLVSTSVTGHEQRRLVATSGRRQFTVTFGILSKTDMATLWSFYKARYGEYDYFYFPNNNERVVNEAVGNKAQNATYTAVQKPLGNVRLVDNAGILTSGLHYTVNKVTGVFTFLRAVTNCWLSYDPAVKVRFMDELKRTEFTNGKFQASMELIEVL